MSDAELLALLRGGWALEFPGIASSRPAADVLAEGAAILSELDRDVHPYSADLPEENGAGVRLLDLLTPREQESYMQEVFTRPPAGTEASPWLRARR